MTEILNISRSDLNDDLKLVADNCGLEVATILHQKLPGITITIPASGHKNLIAAYVFKRYQEGAGVKEIALKVNLSQRQIYNIIKKQRGRKC